MSHALTPEEEFLVAKVSAALASFDSPPPAEVLRAAVLRLRTEHPGDVAAAVPRLRAEVLSSLEQGLRAQGDSQCP